MVQMAIKVKKRQQQWMMRCALGKLGSLKTVAGCELFNCCSVLPSPLWKRPVTLEELEEKVSLSLFTGSQVLVPCLCHAKDSAGSALALTFDDVGSNNAL